MGEDDRRPAAMFLDPELHAVVGFDVAVFRGRCLGQGERIGVHGQAVKGGSVL